MPVPASSTASKSVFDPPRPWTITIVGNGPSPAGGSVTSTSIGTPSKVGTRWSSVALGQNRTPFCSEHAWPKGFGGAALAVAGISRAAAPAATAANFLIDATLEPGPVERPLGARERGAGSDFEPA